MVKCVESKPSIIYRKHKYIKYLSGTANPRDKIPKYPLVREPMHYRKLYMYNGRLPRTNHPVRVSTYVIVTLAIHELYRNVQLLRANHSGHPCTINDEPSNSVSACRLVSRESIVVNAKKMFTFLRRYKSNPSTTLSPCIAHAAKNVVPRRSLEKEGGERVPGDEVIIKFTRSDQCWRQIHNFNAAKIIVLLLLGS